MSASIAHQQDRNKVLQDEIALLDKQIEEINGLDAQKRRLLARMEIIERLQRSRPEIVHVFDEIVRILPEGVYLTYLKQSGEKFEFRGVAQSSTRVSTLMRNIESSPWLTRPELVEIKLVPQPGAKQGDPSKVSEFTLNLYVKQEAPPVQSAPGAPGAPAATAPAMPGSPAGGVPAKPSPPPTKAALASETNA